MRQTRPIASPAGALGSALALPLFWGFALPVGLAALLVDLVATPVVLLARRRPHAPDRAPAGRRASIVIPSWNGRELLAALLPTLRVAMQRAGDGHEALVVDNGSDDGTAAFLAAEHPWVKVVRLERNRFYVGGIRAGVDAARGDVLVLLNNDMRVEPEFLVALLDRFGAPDLFAVTSRIEMPHAEEASAKVETGRTRIVEKKGLLRFEQVLGPDDAPAIPVAWAGGGSTAYDFAKFRELDGMEELYAPCYAEDASVSWLAWKRGWRIEYAPQSVVHHLHRATSTRVFGRSEVEVLDRRNRELMFWRTITDWRIALAHVLWLPWNVRKEARRTGLLVQAKALVRALARLPRALRLRQGARATARRPDRAILRIANDVTAYCRSLGLTGRVPQVLVLHVDRAPRLTLPVPAQTSTVALDEGPLSPVERARRALAEHYADLVVLADDGARAATAALSAADRERVWVASTDPDALAQALTRCAARRR